MTRTELRSHVFRLLFQTEFHGPEERQNCLELYLDGLGHVSDQEKELITNKYFAAAERIPEADALINGASVGWRTARMNKVDLAILRLAVHEMKWDESVPVGVAINEAVELAKKYSGKESASFVNGVLGKLAD